MGGRLRSLGILTVLLGAVLGATLAPSMTAGATGLLPTLTGPAVTPSTITAPGGSAAITATSANATKCTISVTPTIVGLPITFDCSGGTVNQTVRPPLNSSTSTVTYQIVLTATGPGGKAKATLPLSVAPGAGGSALSGVKRIVSDHAESYCALVQGGHVDCWGLGSNFGQLGNGTNTNSTTPVQVVGMGGTGILSGVGALASGSSAYCAVLKGSGAVDCWGSNGNGQLGNGTTATYSSTPIPVVGVNGTGTLTGVASITSDFYGAFCALLTSGGVDCWGYNNGGNLGNGSRASSNIPVQVVGVGGGGTLSAVTSLISDLNGSYCALISSGFVDCWGYGGQGQLGNGTVGIFTSPVQVVGVGGTGMLGGVSALASDTTGYCALLSSSNVDCWGDGVYGDLGYGSNNPSTTPVHVEGVGGTSTTLSGVSSLTGVDGTYCAELTSSDVDCWGNGTLGQLGNGGTTNSNLPVQVAGAGGKGILSGVVSISGDFDRSEPSICARLATGGVDCWGFNGTGALGDGTTTNSDTPMKVTTAGGLGTLSGVKSLQSDQDSFCAVLSGQEAQCWGYGVYGELGNGSVANRDVPVLVLS